MSLSLFPCFCFSISLSVSLHTHIQTHIHTGTYTKKHTSCTKHTCITHHHHHQYPCTHARTHTQQKRPKRSNRNWKQIPCAPQNLPKFSLQVSFSSSSFTSTGQSIFSCCWRSQVRPCAAAINAPCPTGDHRHHRVSQQPSIAKKTSPSTAENASQSLQNPTRKKRNWRKNQWGASTWCLPSQPVLASMRLRTCQQDRSITSVGRPRTSTPSAPHVHTNFAWFQSYSTRNLRTRSRHPPEVASQLMHHSQHSPSERSPIAHVLISLALAPNDAQPKSPPPNGAPSQMRAVRCFLDPVKRHPLLHGHNQAAATETSNCCCVMDVQKRLALSWQYFEHFSVSRSLFRLNPWWPLMPVAESWRLEVLYLCVPRVSMWIALISQKIFRFW